MRFKITRDFYLSGGEEEIKDEETGAVAYLDVSARHADVVGFSGKRQKPDFNYRFPSEQAARDYVQKYFDNLRADAQVKAAWRKEQREFATTLVPGDILYTSWGWEQTNVDWYQVLEVKPSGKTVVIREVAPDAYGEWSGECSPVPGAFVGEPMTKRVRKGDRVTIDDVRSAYKWDGRPKYYSTYA